MSHRIFLLVGIALWLMGCDQVNYMSSVPSSPVRYTVYITRDYPNFVPDNGFQVLRITESMLAGEYIGYAGLLIWVGMDNAYHAADLCCPNCVKKAFPLEVDGIFAVCPLCNEHYDISYGICNPTKGMTKEPLKRYSTIYKPLMTGSQLSVQN